MNYIELLKSLPYRQMDYYSITFEDKYTVLLLSGKLSVLEVSLRLNQLITKVWRDMLCPQQAALALHFLECYHASLHGKYPLCASYHGYSRDSIVQDLRLVPYSDSIYSPTHEEVAAYNPCVWGFDALVQTPSGTMLEDTQCISTDIIWWLSHIHEDRIIRGLYEALTYGLEVHRALSYIQDCHKEAHNVR